MLAQHGVSIKGIKGFIITEGSDDQFIAEKNSEIIRARILNGYTKEKADRYRDQESALLESVFVPQLPPYPEFLMQENACDAKYHPIKKDAPSGVFYTLFANDRLGYGVCADDLIAHRAGFGLFYCPSKGAVVRLEFFTDPTVPKEDIEDLMTSFSCA